MKTIQKLLIIETTIFIVAFLVYMFWMFYPLTPMQLIGPYKVKTPVVIAGQNLIYTAHACRNTTVSGVVEYALEDHIAIPFASTSSLNQPVGCGYKDVAFNIPSIIPPGNYHLHLKATYQINPIRIFTVEVDTQNFQVIANPSAKE